MIYAMNHEEVLFYQAFSIQISCLIDQRIVTLGSKLNYFSIYCQMIMTHVDGGSWICLTCNSLNSYEPSMRLTKNMPFSMLNLGKDEIIFIPEWDFE